MNVLMLAVSGPVLADPAVARAPLQAPLAVQVVAFVDDQVSVELAPLTTEVGLALMKTVGAGTTGMTVTTAEATPDPPGPVHVSVNVLMAAVSGPVLAEPAVARAPPQAPLALHVVALVDDQVSSELPPYATAVGLALSDTVGVFA